MTKLAASSAIAYGAVSDADQPAGDARAPDLRRRDVSLELRVALDELVAVDERGRYDW